MTSGCQQALLSQLGEVITDQPEATAVQDNQAALTYREFGELIATLQNALLAGKPSTESPIGLLFERSAEAYASMWAAISCGRPFVPLNPRYPDSRLRNIISQAGIDTVIATEDLTGRAAELADSETLIITASAAGNSENLPFNAVGSRSAADDDTAYILYTSGSTGEPKGVPISYANLAAFLDNMQAMTPYQPGDVCSQICELTFDVSMLEIFLALLHGGCLCPARPVDLFNPGQYISRYNINVWVSVPSLVRLTLNNPLPDGGQLPSIRMSILAGEGLNVELARAWQAATPDAQLWNAYGPTECTVIVTGQLWSDDESLEEAGIMSIGEPLNDCVAGLLNEAEISPASAETDGMTGELVVSTPQCFSGYTNSGLPSPFAYDDSGRRYYRTGDHVLWRDGRIFYLGRIDYQVKIGGNRIELLEVEHRLRKHLDHEELAVVACPAEQPTELVLCIAGLAEPPALAGKDTGLPAFMLPKRTLLLEQLPVSAHGKIDRGALTTMAEQS